MGPKAKRRRNKLSIIEEEIFNEKLELLLFKYRKDEVEEDEDGMETETVENDSGKGMFEETGNKIQVTDIKNIANELELDWDETVLVILDEKEKKTGLIEDDRVKIIFQVLKVQTAALTSILTELIFICICRLLANNPMKFYICFKLFPNLRLN